MSQTPAQTNSLIAPRAGWLTDDEQASWRAFLRMASSLPEQLNRDLVDSHNVTLADYDVLVQLSEAPENQLRMSELALAVIASRSRLSHQVDRLQRAGLVDRVPCAEDGRGFYARITEEGLGILVAAAPDHVDSVRQHLVDVLTPTEFAEFGATCQKVVDHLFDTQQ